MITGKSIDRASLLQRMSQATSLRPRVRLTVRNSAAAAMLSPIMPMSSVPRVAIPAITETMIQASESSRIAVARISWPRSRRRKPTSISTIATIFTEEIDSAVPMKSAVTNRRPWSGTRLSGIRKPSATPQTKGMAIPVSEVAATTLNLRRTSSVLVSMPVISSKSRMPTSEIAPIIVFNSSDFGKIRS